MIAAMKRLLPLLLALCTGLLMLPSRLSVRAAAEEERYAVAAQTDVWFYAAENEESGLFLLPFSYYVRVLREGAAYTYVQYQDDVTPYHSLKGYCKTEALTFVDFVPERPFLRKEITAVYRVESGSDPLMGGGSFDKVERTFAYYGTSYLGTARFYYVYADGVFDYIPAAQEIVFDYNTDYLEDVSGSGGEEQPPAAEGPSGVQIAVICVIAAACLAVAVLVFRGKRSPSPQEEF